MSKDICLDNNSSDINSTSLEEFYLNIINKIENSNNSIIQDIFIKKDGFNYIQDNKLSYYYSFLSNSYLMDEIEKEVDNYNERKDIKEVIDYCDNIYSLKHIFFNNLSSIINYNNIYDQIINDIYSLRVLSIVSLKSKINSIKIDISKLSRTYFLSSINSDEIASLMLKMDKYSNLLITQKEKEANLPVLMKKLEEVDSQLKESFLDLIMHKAYEGVEDKHFLNFSYKNGLSLVYDEGDLKSYLEEVMRVKVTNQIKLNNLLDDSVDEDIKDIVEKGLGNELLLLKEDDIFPYLTLIYNDLCLNKESDEEKTKKL